jgi:hypothetical protein
MCLHARVFVAPPSCVLSTTSQAMANLSVYPRGRTFMAHNQELVPCLIAMMRSGVTEAARVQYYCAIALCNVLRLDKQTVNI